jgi:beta-glucosidase
MAASTLGDSNVLDIDLNALPAVESLDTNTTPDTEFSSPGSPFGQFDFSEKRFIAQKKLSTLTVEEKVSLLTAADFWRTKAIHSKNIPAIKTSDGPNGVRGGIFVGGTKVSSRGQHGLISNHKRG